MMTKDQILNLFNKLEKHGVGTPRGQKVLDTLVVTTTWEKETPVHIAIKEGKVDLAKALLERGKAELARKQDNNRNTALHIAADYGRTEIVKILLQHDGKNLVYMKNAYGCTALHKAARHGHTDIVKALLELGGEELLHVQDSNRETAFIYAYLWLKSSGGVGKGRMDCFSDIFEILAKRLGGKSFIATQPYREDVDHWTETKYIAHVYFNGDYITYLKINDFPYTKKGYFDDPKKDVLLLKEFADLDVLYDDLADESGVSQLTTEEKLYLYALAFESYAKRKLPATHPDLKLMSTFIKEFDKTDHDTTYKSLLATSIHRVHAVIRGTTRYNLGKLFHRSQTIFDVIPDVVPAVRKDYTIVPKPAAEEDITVDTDTSGNSQTSDSDKLLSKGKVQKRYGTLIRRA